MADCRTVTHDAMLARVVPPRGRGEREKRVLGEVRDALMSSLELSEVVSRVQPLLVDLLSADHAALGVTKPESPGDFEWLVADGARAFFAEYDALAPHDFVRQSVVAAPKRVMRDSDMITRRDLEANVMYHRARELGMPLEQVMGVMLHAETAWSSGLAVYRSTRSPFSARERALLQGLTPALAQTVRNCRRFAETRHRARVLERLLGERGAAIVVLAPPAREIVRTEAASALLERWFHSTAIDPLLRFLFDVPLRAGTSSHDVEPCSYRLPGSDARLLVRQEWLPHDGQHLRVLTLEEIRRNQEVPPAWCKRLTPRECDVASRTVRGWDNRLIAEDLGCALGTVKKHIGRVFDKIGVDSRAQLIARANEEP